MTTTQPPFQFQLQRRGEPLSHLVAQALGVSRARARRIVADLLGPEGLIQGALAAGERVTIPGFGALEVVKLPPRRYRDPQTGEEKVSRGSATVRLRPGRGLRRAVGE